MNVGIKDRPLDVSPTAPGQGEAFWLAFPALPPEARILEVPR